MLQSLRSQANGWVIKFLLAAIVASFALWGITDIIRGIGENPPVAEVGGHSISVEEFSHAYKNALKSLQAQYKGEITPEQIAGLRIGDKILDNLVDAQAMYQALHSAEIVISDQTLTNEVRSLPSFIKKDGTFDNDNFRYMLQARGMSEKQFVNDMRKDLQQFQFLESLTAGFQLSDAYIKALYIALEQPFHFVALDIPFNKITLNEPTVAELEFFFKNNMTAFQTPEMRSFNMLSFSRGKIMGTMNISDEDLRQEYDRRIAEFETPEKRTVQQFKLTSPDQAPQLKTMLASGKPAPAIAREMNITVQSIDNITREQFTEKYPDQADAVFALLQGHVTEPFDVASGWVVYVASTITKGETKSFDAVKKDLLAPLKQEKFNDAFDSLQREVEDAIAGGAAFKDVANRFGLTLTTMAPLTSTGKDKTGATPLNKNVAQEALTFIFGNNQGTDSPIIQSIDTTQDTFAVIIKIGDIVAPHVPEFKEIRGNVKRAYDLDQKQKEAEKIIKKAKESIKNVSELKKFATAQHFSVITVKPLSRSTAQHHDTYDSGTMERLFSLNMRELMPVQTKEGFHLVMLEKRDPVTINQEKLSKFSKAMHNLYKQDIKEGYRQNLRTLYPVILHKEKIEHVTGATS